MGSTAKRVAAELQYASRKVLKRALRKLELKERKQIQEVVEILYQKLSRADATITKTDIFRLLASLGAFSVLQDPEYTGSS